MEKDFLSPIGINIMNDVIEFNDTTSLIHTCKKLKNIVVSNVLPENVRTKVFENQEESI